MSEWLTDKEKRLLFSALTREKKVCAEVDKDCCREPYEESLVSVVESLEHKFCYDRLFKQMEKQIRADAIDEALQIIHNIYTQDSYCDVCDRDNQGYDCEDCLYKSVKHNLEQLKEQNN